MKSTDPEPHGVGMELEQYRTRLEQMVEEKSKDLIAIQENLEATNRRQALFIKVLQILQLEPDIPTAMNMALAEIGRYTGVDRLATWENHLDGVTYGCTYEWCNDGIEPAIDYLRSMTIEAGKPWFDMLEEKTYHLYVRYLFARSLYYSNARSARCKSHRCIPLVTIGSTFRISFI